MQKSKGHIVEHYRKELIQLKILIKYMFRIIIKTKSK